MGKMVLENTIIFHDSWFFIANTYRIVSIEWILDKIKAPGKMTSYRELLFYDSFLDYYIAE